MGVDIGASGYRVAIVRGGELVDMVQGHVRPSVSATGPDLRAVSDAVAREVTVSTRRHGLDVATLGLGVAGGRAFPNVTEALLPILNIVHADMMAVFADGVSSYVGALGFEAGAVLAAGTGSVVIATDATTTWRRTDGLGHLLGDIGSGAWIGRRALEVAVRHATGRPTTSAALRTAAESRFGSVATLVNDLHRSPDPSATMASFVPDVVAAAREDDAAAELLAQAADELAATLLHAADGLTRRLAAVGGIAGQDGPLRHLLEQRLTAAGHELTEAAGSAAEGAAHIVRALSQDTLPEVFRDQLLAVHT
ncbi:BadF/BadG/BcrA/BcrD ATPase family protein [Haloactinopolyspora alba]|uniref:BadF/BadG/BcrA/BcrD ATPase family protein n=1 Tax=Haloactinopolyspora alba TaxID=648780 RepID=UPI003B8466D8